MNRVAVITGGSSGIGRATARCFAQKGWSVFELSRSGHTEGSVTHIAADVTDSDSLGAAFAEVVSREGRMDVLVCCAGFGISGAIEVTRIEDAQRQMDVNFMGTVRTIQAALPYLRQSRGHIVNVSSLGGPLALPFQAFYSCSKAAVNALTLALANELRPFGIAVCAVMPGDVHTGFTAARVKSDAGEELYGERIRRSVASMEHDEQNGMSPDHIAVKIYKMAQKKHPKPLFTVGFVYQLFALLDKLLPARLINFLVGRLYS